VVKKVSIVTISYNQVEFLERCIRSVLEQNYGNIEYIVVDAGSLDGSRELIDRYRERIDRVIFEPDDGPADGLNKGFAVATGEIFAYLNADDLLHPQAVSHFAELFDKWPDADVISGHAYKIDEHDRILSKTYSHRFDPVAYVYGACILVQQSTFFRASTFQGVGGFNAHNRVSWDGELWFDMALHGARFRRTAGFWSSFRIHPESITVSGRLRQKEEGVEHRLAEKIGIGDAQRHSRPRRRLYRLKSRLSDPLTTVRRALGI
jgi:glycosyltransferase involved in cell wall biosynthesis